MTELSKNAESNNLVKPLLSSRLLKFRAWDTDGTMFYSSINGEWSVGNFGIYCRYGGDRIMQFIGLEDINGIEIYEGDIVKWGHRIGGEENPIRIAVVKVQPDIQFHIINYKMDFAGQNRIFHYGSFAYKDTYNWLEVIGNIFENPELL